MNELFIVDLIRNLLKEKIEIDDLKVYKHNEYEFIIHDMEGHRINMVKISKNEDSEEVNEE